MRAGRSDVRAEDLKGAVVLGLRALYFPEAPDGGLEVLGILSEVPRGYHLALGDCLYLATPRQRTWWRQNQGEVTAAIVGTGTREDGDKVRKAKRWYRGPILHLAPERRRVG